MLANLMDTLRGQNSAFRLIPENSLTTEWHQLDRLFVAPELVSPQGVRKLQGFKAAGGELVFLGKNEDFSL